MSARIHLRNLAFNWGGHAATLLVMFFLSPYIVGKLDAVAYGIWSLLNVLTGYMGIFDLGVRASVGRHVALYLGKEDPVGVDETIRAGFGFFSLAGGLILLVGIGLGWLFPAIFDGVSPEYYDTVRVLLPLMVVNVWLSAIAAIYSSVMAAHDRFDIARGVDMIVLLVRTVGTVYVLEKGWGLWGLVFAVIAGNICAVIGNRLFAGRVHAGLRSFPFVYKKVRFKELFGYGIPASITNASFKIIGQSDLVIVGCVISVASVREYNVGATLVMYSLTFIVLIGRTFFPSLQKSISRGDRDDAIKIFYRQSLLALAFGILVYIGFIFYSESFMYLWMKQDGFGMVSVISSSKVMMLLSISCLLSLVINPCRDLLAAIGHVGFCSKIVFYEALLNVFLSVLLVYLGFGLYGVAASTAIARFVITFFAIPLYTCEKMEIRKLDFIKKIILPYLLSIFVFSLVCKYFSSSISFGSISQFVYSVVSVTFVWSFLALLFLVPQDLRKQYVTKLLWRA